MLVLASENTLDDSHRHHFFRIATTASANAAGCKDPTKDPNFDNEQWRDQLPEFCRNKRASAAFFWFSWCE